jgi:two-component system cell cycle sensor histidine kinase/response regulator CckA
LVCRSRSFQVLVVDGELEVLALAANILQGEGYTSTQRLGMTSPPPKPVGTILVVDDDQEVLAVAVDILEMARYTVLSTADPRHALRLVRTYEGPIHLLLTDVVMPLMNGLQLAAEVQALRPEAKILLMSAYRTKEIDDYRMRLGLQGLFLDKPFTVAALTGAVRSLLDDRAPRPWRRSQ